MNRTTLAIMAFMVLYFTLGRPWAHDAHVPKGGKWHAVKEAVFNG